MSETAEPPMLIRVPLRPDVTVSVQMPWDLSRREADKVKRVLEALALGTEAGNEADDLDALGGRTRSAKCAASSSPFGDPLKGCDSDGSLGAQAELPAHPQPLERSR